MNQLEQREMLNNLKKIASELEGINGKFDAIVGDITLKHQDQKAGVQTVKKTADGRTLSMSLNILKVGSLEHSTKQFRIDGVIVTEEEYMEALKDVE